MTIGGRSGVDILGWTFVPLTTPITVLSGVTIADTAIHASAPLGLPADAIAVSGSIGCRDDSGTAGAAGGGDFTFTVHHAPNGICAGAKTSGVFGRGGFSPFGPAVLDSNGCVLYNVSSTTAHVWLYVYGYWTSLA